MTDKGIENSEPNYYELNKKIKKAEVGKQITIETKTGKLGGIVTDTDGRGQVTIDTGVKSAGGLPVHAIIQSTDGHAVTGGGPKQPGRYVHVETYTVSPTGETKQFEPPKDSDILVDVR